MLTPKNISYRPLVGIIFLGYLLTAGNTPAQIVEDGTVDTRVTPLDDRNFSIEGGREINGNLFHSFREFSVPEGGSAVFIYNPNLQNIINRVTGGSLSRIDGTIQANQGSANFFLINPNGIIFGPNARLNVTGSFVASTADSIVFDNQGVFSASNPRDASLLNVNIPIGLYFGRNPGSIVNRSIGFSSVEIPGSFGGLYVLPGKTLALVGGDVAFEEGEMITPGARVEIGSVEGENLVGLIPVQDGWTFGYENVSAFRDIRLSSSSFIQTYDYDEAIQNTGDIRLQGRGISIEDSQVLTTVKGEGPGGNITIDATDRLEVLNGEVTGGSYASATGPAGSISISTGRLILAGRSNIDSSSDGIGSGGDLTIRARESIEIADRSKAFSSASGSGRAGEFSVTTRRLVLRNGGQLGADTGGSTDGGVLRVRADESIEIEGWTINGFGNFLPSGIFATTNDDGNGGAVRIDTGRLSVRDRAGISVSASGNGTGRAGQLTITTNFLSLGDGAQISASSFSSRGGDLNLRVANHLQVDNSEISASTESGIGGNLSIEADRVDITNGGTISVRGKLGQAGNLRMNANSLFLNRGAISAETGTSATEGANISLKVADSLRMGNGSSISATANDVANGGNINIDTDFLVAFPQGNSDITANAQGGRGGAIEITTRGIFGMDVRGQLTPDNDITAFSQLQPTLNGVITLNTAKLDPSLGVIEFPTTVVDPNTLIAQNPCRKGTNSELTLTGRGGIPATPADTLDAPTPRVGLIAPVSPTTTKIPRSVPATDRHESKLETPIVPARGWVYNGRGEVVLIAENPLVTESRPTHPQSTYCQVPNAR